MFSSLSTSIALLPLLQALATAKPVTGFSWNSTTSLLAFGDSYTYIQGTPHGRINGSFIRDEINFGFTPEELLENQIILNASSTENSNWVEFLSGCYEGPPAECTGDGQIPLWDFAFGGADVSAEQFVFPVWWR